MNATSLSDLLKLSPAERIQLAQDLWDSVPEDAIPLTEEQVAELERRMAEHRSNPASAVAWDEVRERLRARFGA
jgi:putative addiction module component (TIGR02574 family)